MEAAVAFEKVKNFGLSNCPLCSSCSSPHKSVTS